MGPGKSTLHSVNMHWMLLQYLLLPQNMMRIFSSAKKLVTPERNRATTRLRRLMFGSVVEQWYDYSAILGFNSEVAGFQQGASEVREGRDICILESCYRRQFQVLSSPSLLPTNRMARFGP